MAYHSYHNIQASIWMPSAVGHVIIIVYKIIKKVWDSYRVIVINYEWLYPLNMLELQRRYYYMLPDHQLQVEPFAVAAPVMVYFVLH